MDSHSAFSNAAEQRTQAGNNEQCKREKREKREKRPDWESCPLEPKGPLYSCFHIPVGG